MKPFHRSLFALGLALLLGLGAILLAAGDFRPASAAPEPDAWIAAADLPQPLGSQPAQCPDQPDIVYLVGGILTGGLTSDTLYRYDAVTNTWTQLADLPVPLRGMGIACYQGRIYVAGGLIDYMNRLYIYDIASDTWTQGADLPDNTGGPALGAWDGKLYLVGGSRVQGQPYTPIARVDVYDIATDTWTAGGGMDMPAPAAYFGAVQRGRYLFAVGGVSGDPANNVNQTQRYDMVTNTWETGPTFTSQRGINTLSMSVTHLYSLGGDVNGGTFFDATDLVEALDLSAWPAGAWSNPADPLPLPNLYAASACTEALAGGEIWDLGGIDGNLNPRDDVYYRPVSEACFDFYFGNLAPESLASGNPPGGVVTYTLSVFNDGTLPDTYDLSASGVWTVNLPATIGPLAPGESAALTITVEIPPGASLGDTDTATITLTSQADPTAVDTATLVTTAVDWTPAANIPEGTFGYAFAQCPDNPDQFYVLGGGDPVSKAFWLFDASTNTWTALPDLPQALRAGAATCYQGKIYLTGGFNGSIRLNTLYIYDIASQAWASGAFMPHSNIGHAMGAWDGKLYLAGGTLDPIPWPPINHVDIYDINTNTWQEQAGSPLPVAVMGAGYVQQGSYLFLAGGWSGNANNNRTSTLRYDMADDNWESGPAFTSARAFFALATTNSHLYALGGDLNGGNAFDATNLVEVLDLSTWPAGSWADLGDPLPQPVVFNSAGFCNEAVTGGEIWSVSGADASMVEFDSVYYRPVFEPCFDFYAPDLTLESMALGNPPGQWVHYILPVANNGTLTDTYDIEVTGAWPGVHPLSIGPLASGQTGLLEVQVLVPVYADPGDTDTAVVTITSQNDAQALDTAVLVSTAEAVYGVELAPPAPALSGLPGETLVYTITLTNQGNTTDTFTLSAISEWPLTLSPSLPITLSASESADLLAYVTIPEDALPDETDTATLTAVSQGDPEQTAESLLTSTALGVYGVDLTPAAPALSGNPGETLAYTITLTNQGNTTDTFTLSAISEWPLTLSPSLPITLSASESADLLAYVTIPEDAPAGDSDTATLTAVSQGDPEQTAESRLTSTALPYADFAITPTALALSAAPGQVVTYTLTLSNLGNLTDTYTLEISASWQVQLPITQVTLAPSAATQLIINVAIPQDALSGDSDTAILTIASQVDPLLTRQATLTTTATIVSYKIWLPVVVNQ